MKTLVIILCIGIAALLPPALIANVHRVPQQYASIQSAIDASSTNDTILVSAGIYLENLNFRGKTIVVKGDALTEDVIVNGSQPIFSDSASVVVFASGETSTSVLEGFTITGGTGTITSLGKIGGGIFCTNAKPTIRNCIIKGNESIAGGGIGLWQATDGTLIINCIIYNNAATGGYGGGVWAGHESVTISNCTLFGNTASYDGGNLAFTSFTADSPVNNSIIWSGSIAAFTMQGNINYCDIQGGWPSGTGNIDVDPLFCNSGSGDFHIAAKSPCLGSGQGGVTIGALGQGCDSVTTPLIMDSTHYSLFDYPLKIGTSWTYRYTYAHQHMGIYGNKSGLHHWTITDSVTITDSTVVYNCAVINEDTSSEQGSTPVPVYSTSSFTITIRSSQIEVDFPTIYGPTGNDLGFLPGDLEDSAYYTTGWPNNYATYKKGVGLQYYYCANYTNTYYEEKLELIAFNNTPVGVVQETRVPDRLSLYQNYPNPFNPSTTIKYNIPFKTHVRIKVYDIYGRDIVTLVNEVLPIGEHSVVFNATGFSSGIYFYRIQCGNSIITKKLVLLK